MSINPAVRYPANTTPPDASYPLGSAKNSTAPGAKNGFPFEKDYINDILGLNQALLTRAGVTASGVADTATLSQYLQSLMIIHGVEHDTVAEMTADIYIFVGMKIRVAERKGTFTAVLASGVTENTANIIAGVVDIAISFVLDVGSEANSFQFGIPGDGSEQTVRIQALLDFGAANDIKIMLVGEMLATDELIASPVGNFEIDGTQDALITSTFTDDGSGKAALKILGAATTRLKIGNFKINYTPIVGTTFYGFNVPDKIESADFDNFGVSGGRFLGAEINADHQVHKNCNYSDNFENGLSVLGGYWELLGIKASNNGNGVDNTTGRGVILSGTGGFLLGGEFKDNDRYNIDARRANNFVIDGPLCENAGLAGIYAVNEDSEKDMSNCKIINPIVDQKSRVDSERGIWVGTSGAGSTATSGEIDVSNATVKNCLREGILISAGSGSFPPEKVTANKNKITNCGTAFGEHGLVIGDAGSIIASGIADGNQLEDSNEIQILNVDDGKMLNNINKSSGAETRAYFMSAITATVIGNSTKGNFTGNDVIEVSATNQEIWGNNCGSWFKSNDIYNPPSLADGANTDVNVVVDGVKLNDKVFATFSLDTQGIHFEARVVSTGNVTVKLDNETGGVLDLGSGTLNVSAVRSI